MWVSSAFFSYCCVQNAQLLLLHTTHPSAANCAAQDPYSLVVAWQVASERLPVLMILAVTPCPCVQAVRGAIKLPELRSDSPKQNWYRSAWLHFVVVWCAAVFWLKAYHWVLNLYRSIHNGSYSDKYYITLQPPKDASVYLSLSMFLQAEEQLVCSTGRSWKSRQYFWAKE